jgi:hypothetical protein
VSFIGTGGEDWVELDMDLFERSRFSQLQTRLIDHGQDVASAIGSEFEIETASDGAVFLVVDGKRRFQAEVGNNERLLLTGILDPDGPL